VFEDRALRAAIASAAAGQLAPAVLHRLQFADLGLQGIGIGIGMGIGELLGLGAAAPGGVPQAEQGADLLDREAQAAGAADELQPVHVAAAAQALAGEAAGGPVAVRSPRSGGEEVSGDLWDRHGSALQLRGDRLGVAIMGSSSTAVEAGHGRRLPSRYDSVPSPTCARTPCPMFRFAQRWRCGGASACSVSAAQPDRSR